MTHNLNSTTLMDAMQVIEEHGLEGMNDAFSILFNHAMTIERSKALQAQPYERTDERKGYANGFKPRTLNTRMGKLKLQIPQVRGEVNFYPQSLERGCRSERALKLAIAQMYVQGVSTRRVTPIMEELCGLEVTSSQVSRAAAELDAELQKWRQRPLGVTPYLMLDARYEKVRCDGAVRSCAVLVATAVTADGKRSILGTSVSLSEAEIHWREFLHSLIDRGLCRVSLVTSDAHEGLKAALQSSFPGAAWQRCQTHIQRNAAGYVPRKEMQKEVAADIRDTFAAPSLEEAERLLAKAVEKYQPIASKLAAWLADTLPDGFAVFSLPSPHRKRLRTTNTLENLNKQIKRRTRVATLFPNEASLLRLVSAVLMETSEEWESGKVYLNMTL